MSAELFPAGTAHGDTIWFALQSQLFYFATFSVSLLRSLLVSAGCSGYKDGFHVALRGRFLDRGMRLALFRVKLDQYISQSVFNLDVQRPGFDVFVPAAGTGE